jgi:hypothetical protein
MTVAPTTSPKCTLPTFVENDADAMAFASPVFSRQTGAEDGGFELPFSSAPTPRFAA